MIFDVSGMTVYIKINVLYEEIKIIYSILIYKYLYVHRESKRHQMFFHIDGIVIKKLCLLSRSSKFKLFPRLQSSLGDSDQLFFVNFTSEGMKRNLTLNL